jgi:hypothetical protein
MDGTSASAASSPDAGVAYEATIARRAQDQQRIEGAAALRLIEAAATAGTTPQRPLPAGATISVRA